jgi:hypothetical protein
LRAACTREIDQDDTYDQGGLDAFTQSNEKSWKQAISSCYSFATTL